MTCDKTLEQAARIVENITSWGLSRTKLEAVENFQKYAAETIRAQKSGGEERKKLEKAA